VLASNPNARQISLAPRIEALRSESILNASGAEQLHRNITPEGTLRLLPGAFHTDGFFVALLERTV
jgi:16S rRNA C967 or C1407 C5-methylase (RsmB/RsmF family)